MRIYNLFPRLAGEFTDWHGHLQRAADMDFDWVFVNPIQALGRSRSLYSIADYFQINPEFVNERLDSTPEDQVRGVCRQAEALGLRMMVDLVINHCAADSPLTRQHPDWFVRDDRGQIAHPGCIEDGERVVWHDLAMFNHPAERDDRGLFAYCKDVVEYLIDLGFSGFRCDAAYKVPPDVWRRLIGEIKQGHPDVVFTAETLGCRPHQTRETAESGFDYVFNSAKWWDFESPWLMEQYELTRQSVRSVSFPESHDTERLFHETGHNVAAQKQRYLFAALFSAGVMMPAGYEFGFTRRPHVVESRPEHWEEPNIDLVDFIGAVNRVKRDWPLFQEEGVTEILPHANPAILLIWKASVEGRGEALVILNKDVHQWQTFETENLCQLVQASPPLKDVSVEWPMDYLPAPFTFELHPGMARILVAEA